MTTAVEASAKLTVVHVTHEATEHVGGIGTVLAGLISAPSYRAAVGRSILVGPLFHPHRHVTDPKHRLGESAVECFYSGADQHDPKGLSALLHPIEWAMGTRIVYGTRELRAPGYAPAIAEVLLLDVSNPDADRLGALKWFLYEKFGIDSRKYEHSWDYEEYCRLAGMAYHALSVLTHGEKRPAMVISHEYMGMCTALRCAADRSRFRAVFHAHECSTGRRIVEHLPGHDAAFYPVMAKAMKDGRFVEGVFGDQSDYSRHALVGRAYLLDGVLAVGPQTADELKFMSREMNACGVRIAYNGLPAPKVDLPKKQASRRVVNAWLKQVIGYEPDVLITHVTRPVPSKGLWRDVQLMKALTARLKKAGKSAAYVLLTCGAPVRNHEQVNAMAKDYGWPGVHREGYPDLAGPEVQIAAGIETLNVDAQKMGAHVRGVLVNQFGFSRARVGDALSEAASVDDLRIAADVELGMSVYEPYGIAQLEPLYAGAICIPSSACGCIGLVKRAISELGLTAATCPIVLEADFADEAMLPERSRAALKQGGDLSPAIGLTSTELRDIEARVCERLADELMKRLPSTDVERTRLIELGQRLAAKMSWDRVATTDFLPAIEAAMAK